MTHVERDPNFFVSSPTAGQVLGSDFSVYGTCSSGTTNIVAYVGNYNALATISPTGTSWEAIFTGVQNGSYGVYATCSNNGRTPPLPATIPVTVQGITGLTVKDPTAPSPAEREAAAGTNPWDGWQSGGDYTPGTIARMEIWLTQYGVPVMQSLSHPQPASGPATFHSHRPIWTCGLNFVPAAYTGAGFLIHYTATLPGGVVIIGTGTKFFDGPS